ncbi:MAG: hypothetical protein ACE5K1_02135 [Acidiferrobacterales bacterium]
MSKFNRRSFVKLCASAVALITANPNVLARSDGALRHYRRARIVDDWDRPLVIADLKEGESYIFHYPYISTPCFLLNLGKPTAAGTTLKTKDGDSYRWQGGVGPNRSVVAFSAICAHRMTHPARSVSFINYRHKNVDFLDKDENKAERSRIIYCCSEKSVYDPTQGARVLGGPAPQPLAAISLEYDDKNGLLYATGTYGGDMFDKFFKEFGFRLRLEHKTTDVREEVTAARVYTLAEYCETQVLC